MPGASLVFITHKWLLGPAMCYAITAVRFVVAFASWLTIALIAVNRCLTIITPRAAHEIFTGWRGKALLIFIWIVSVIYMIPIFTEVLFDFIASVQFVSYLSMNYILDHWNVRLRLSSCLVHHYFNPEYNTSI